MARHLASLKLALLTGGIRRGGSSAVVGLILALLFSIGFGGLAALGLASTRELEPAASTDIAAAMFAGMLLLWTLGPLLALASDSTLDVDRLAMFPLTARQLMPGLLLSAAVGVGGLFTIIVFVGALAGIAGSGVSALVALAAVTLELALCMAVSRLVSTALSAATSKRRWRDVALFVGPVLALSVQVGLQVANRTVFAPSANVGDGPRADPHSLAVAREVVRWLPTGWATQAVRGARTGNYALALAGLIATAALVVGVMALWWRAIQRATTTTPMSGTPRRGERRALIPRVAAWLPTNAFGAIVAKELRYTWRDPRRRAGILALAMAGVVPVLAFRGVSTSSPRLCLMAAWPSLNIGFNANAFGFDGERIWADVAAGVSVATQLAARTVARVLFALPVVGVLLAGFAALSHSLVGLVPAVGLVAAALGVSSGFAAVMSVNTPIAMPDAGSGNIFGGGTGGQNAAAGGAAAGALFGTMFAVSPVLIATLALPVRSASQVLVLVFGLGVGWVGWRTGLRRATGIGRPGPADLLAKLTRA